MESNVMETIHWSKVCYAGKYIYIPFRYVVISISIIGKNVFIVGDGCLVAVNVKCHSKGLSTFLNECAYYFYNNNPRRKGEKVCCILHVLVCILEVLEQHQDATVVRYPLAGIPINPNCLLASNQGKCYNNKLLGLQLSGEPGTLANFYSAWSHSQDIPDNQALAKST